VQIGDGKCEVTSVVIGEGDATFDIKKEDATFDIREGDATFDSVRNCSPPRLNPKILMNHCHQKARALNHIRVKMVLHFQYYLQCNTYLINSGL